MCYQKYVREEFLQPQVVDAVKKLALPEDWADKMIAEVNREKAAATDTTQETAQAAQKEMAEVEKTTERLLDTYLAGDLTREEYLKKRTDLVGRKMALKENSERLARDGNDRFEPLLNFLEWSKGLNKEVLTGNWRALTEALQKAHSNRALIDRTIRLSVDAPYSLLAEKRAAKKWCARPDSNWKLFLRREK